MSDEIVWVGNASRSEFKRITDALRLSGSLTLYDDAATVPGKVVTPAVVCLAAARPGEVSPQRLEQVRTKFPASDHVTVLGELCCGLKRTAAFLDPVTTVYSHELPSDCTVQTLLEHLHAPPAFNFGPVESKFVAIYSKSSNYERGIAEALEMLGNKTARLSLDDASTVAGVDFVIWEVSDGIDEFPVARKIRRRHPDAEIIALVSYPREYEVTWYEQQGIRVLAQPYSLSNLFSIFRSPREFLATSAA